MSPLSGAAFCGPSDLPEALSEEGLRSLLQNVNLCGLATISTLDSLEQYLTYQSNKTNADCAGVFRQGPTNILLVYSREQSVINRYNLTKINIKDFIKNQATQTLQDHVGRVKKLLTKTTFLDALNLADAEIEEIEQQTEVTVLEPGQQVNLPINETFVASISPQTGRAYYDLSAVICTKPCRDKQEMSNLSSLSLIEACYNQKRAGGLMHSGDIIPDDYYDIHPVIRAALSHTISFQSPVEGTLVNFWQNAYKEQGDFTKLKDFKDRVPVTIIIQKKHRGDDGEFHPARCFIVPLQLTKAIGDAKAACQVVAKTEKNMICFKVLANPILLEAEEGKVVMPLLHNMTSDQEAALKSALSISFDDDVSSEKVPCQGLSPFPLPIWPVSTFVPSSEIRDIFSTSNIVTIHTTQDSSRCEESIFDRENIRVRYHYTDRGVVRGAEDTSDFCALGSALFPDKNITGLKALTISPMEAGEVHFYKNSLIKALPFIFLGPADSYDLQQEISRDYRLHGVYILTQTEASKFHELSDGNFIKEKLKQISKEEFSANAGGASVLLVAFPVQKTEAETAVDDYRFYYICGDGLYIGAKNLSFGQEVTHLLKKDQLYSYVSQSSYIHRNALQQINPNAPSVFFEGREYYLPIEPSEPEPEPEFELEFEQELSEPRSFYHELMEMSPEQIFVEHSDALKHTFNQLQFSVFGYEKLETIKRRIFKILENKHKDYKVSGDVLDKKWEEQLAETKRILVIVESRNPSQVDRQKAYLKQLEEEIKSRAPVKKTFTALRRVLDRLNHNFYAQRFCYNPEVKVRHASNQEPSKVNLAQKERREIFENFSKEVCRLYSSYETWLNENSGHKIKLNAITHKPEGISSELFEEWLNNADKFYALEVQLNDENDVSKGYVFSDRIQTMTLEEYSSLIQRQASESPFIIKGLDNKICVMLPNFKGNTSCLLYESDVANLFDPKNPFKLYVHLLNLTWYAHLSCQNGFKQSEKNLRPSVKCELSDRLLALHKKSNEPYLNRMLYALARDSILIGKGESPLQIDGIISGESTFFKTFKRPKTHQAFRIVASLLTLDQNPSPKKGRHLCISFMIKAISDSLATKTRKLEKVKGGPGGGPAISDHKRISCDGLINIANKLSVSMSLQNIRSLRERLRAIETGLNKESDENSRKIKDRILKIDRALDALEVNQDLASGSEEYTWVWAKDLLPKEINSSIRDSLCYESDSKERSTGHGLPGFWVVRDIEGNIEKVTKPQHPALYEKCQQYDMADNENSDGYPRAKLQAKGTKPNEGTSRGRAVFFSRAKKQTSDPFNPLERIMVFKVESKNQKETEDFARVCCENAQSAVLSLPGKIKRQAEVAAEEVVEEAAEEVVEEIREEGAINAQSDIHCYAKEIYDGLNEQGLDSYEKESFLQLCVKLFEFAQLDEDVLPVIYKHCIDNQSDQEQAKIEAVKEVNMTHPICDREVSGFGANQKTCTVELEEFGETMWLRIAESLNISQEVDPELEYLKNIGFDFMCPITGNIIKDPVVAPDGVTYDRSAIEKIQEADPTAIDFVTDHSLKSLLIEHRDLIKSHEGVKDKKKAQIFKIRRAITTFVNSKASFSFQSEESIALLDKLEKLKSLKDESKIEQNKANIRNMSHCPITLEPFTEPVIASDGFTYEKSALKKVLESSNPQSPMTLQPFQNKQFHPNYALRRIREAVIGYGD